MHGGRPFRTSRLQVAGGRALLYLFIVAALFAIFLLPFGMSAEMSTRSRYRAKRRADASV